MEEAATEAADHGQDEDNPVVCRKSKGTETESTEKHTERDNPRAGYAVGVIADNGLCHRRQEYIGKMMPAAS